MATRTLLQEVNMIIGASLNDWVLYPRIGADLDDLIGQNNTEDLAQDATRKIMASIFTIFLYILINFFFF